MTVEERELRTAIVEKARWMSAKGLTHGTSGNISARCGTLMLLTPSAVPYEAMEPEMLAAFPLDGPYGHWEGPLKPSTEWRFHYDILRDRPDVGAIVHAHSTYATVLAITRRGIPAVHYMMAAFGGTDIRCGGYARFGTPELSAHAIRALEGRNGCLLANHGMIAVGDSLDRAMWRASELETLAQQFYMASLIGGAVILDEAAIAETAAAFKGYGVREQSPQPGEVSGADATPPATA